MIIDGKHIAAGIIRTLTSREDVRALSLTVISIDPTFATKKYLAIKERVALEVGVMLEVVTLPAHATTKDVLDAISSRKHADGVVLQLPYPPHIDMAALLQALPQHQDVDVMGDAARSAFEEGDELVTPPVVAAIARMSDEYAISFAGKHVVVIGKGKLVGAPAATWARRQGATVTALSKTDDSKPFLKDADIVISGAGAPGLIQPSMIKEGVVIFDAGTSEDAGKLRGDADAQCAAHASFMTPVPGGIGPVAVALLFDNLVTLARARQKLSMD
jgi:methylenetetrahydrofolate dehydrogenase (NADP+)/methenyltetrahydrofolate cyclohydrolase